MIDLSGRTALVTGASRGIGEATARRLAQAGAAVALTARSGEAIQKIAGEINADGGRAVAFSCDAGDFAAVEATVAAAASELGPLDSLINNAGMLEPIGDPHELDPEAFMTNLRVNVGSALAFAKAVIPSMLERKAGTIVNISSGAAHSPLEGWTAYCTAKAALYMLTRNLAHTYGEAGLRIYGFGPGVVDTKMQEVIRGSGIGPVAKLKRSDLQPVERPAEVLAWLCSDAAADLAGQELSIRDPELMKRVGLEAA
jgi:NAD(P)-dependent dehydrogenase (short-subunit alcohol dehydrogenase family)